ncbi:MAG: 1-(5-phosphoribosyl)-5-[(5-phosphoribosylamino)methylideneamino] imidazole-4-carboxamide isomerase [Chloroflexota bacterium]
MELICAVDLLDGGAVRLEQGDYERRVAQGLDPLELVEGWVGDGARRIHIIDLEGARRRAPAQLPLVARIVDQVRRGDAAVRVELGGGLRTVADVAAAFEVGVDDAILGSAAIAEPGFLEACARQWPQRIFASLDLRDGQLAVEAWTQRAGAAPIAVARRLADEGAARLLITDASRDGTLAGPNVALLSGMRAALRSVPLVAAGGVASVEDLLALKSAGIDGAIVGLALLTGQVHVREALTALEAAA